LQVFGLNRGPHDLLLSDRSMYRYVERLLERTTRFRAKGIAMHNFAEEDPQNYRPLLRDPQILDNFNAGLKQLTASGCYQAIFAHYLKPPESPVSQPEKKHPHPGTPGTADDNPPTARR
jgi:polar amino acid transport system substrate-binding protein